MKCIDGIEGVVRCVLDGFKLRYAEGSDDDSEFAANVKTTIENACRFLDENKEIGVSGQLLRQVLFDESQKWWLERAGRLQKKDAEEDGSLPFQTDEEYNEFYFNSLYNRGVYPA
ncbi:MAG: hypothetical protein KKA60_05980 [Proteobacteria bacterium]|nr:hypothetical protein [Pseudomonadota bacterium]